ncbi:MAG: V4R domain-containing protein [Promethearchaeota archaeon]
MTPSKRASFEVYFSEDGLRQVSNPVRMKILEMLQEAEGLELKDIYLHFEKSGQRKSKSTLWEHLKTLIDKKLVIERPHPEDKRRKLFLLNSKFVGTTEMPMVELSEQLSVIIQRSIGDPLYFANGLFCAVRFGIESFTNFNLDPILKEVGKTIGQEIAKTLTIENLDDLLNTLSNFWETHKLGHLQVVSKAPITLLVTDCYECSGMPNVGKCLCAQDEGILEAIFESKFKKSCKVEEEECHGTGHPHCKFNITFPLI